MRRKRLLWCLAALGLLAAGGRALAGERRTLTPEQVAQMQKQMEERRKAYFQKRYGNDWQKAYEKDRQRRQLRSAQGASALFQEAEKAFQAEKYGIAHNYYVDVAAYGDSQGAAELAARSRERIYEVRHLAEDKLDQAKLRIRLKDAPGAAELLTDLVEKFAFSAAATEARGLLRSLEKDPRVAARALLAEAEAADAGELWADAVGLYRELVERYPESVEAFKAARRLEELLKDEAVQEALRAADRARADEKAPPLLRLARNFALNDRKEEAAARYRAVAEGFQGTRYAEHALACIKALEAGEKLPEPLAPPAPPAPPDPPDQAPDPEEGEKPEGGGAAAAP